jgi:hypothetical protein
MYRAAGLATGFATTPGAVTGAGALAIGALGAPVVEAGRGAGRGAALSPLLGIGDWRPGRPRRWALPTTAFLVTLSLRPISLVGTPDFQSLMRDSVRFAVHSTVILSSSSVRPRRFTPGGTGRQGSPPAGADRQSRARRERISEIKAIRLSAAPAAWEYSHWARSCSQTAGN